MYSATFEDLFLPEVDVDSLFEKEATIARLPDDDKKWPEVILSELHRQIPFLSGYDIAINLSRIEPEAGFGFGYAIVKNSKSSVVQSNPKDESKMVKIPLVISDRYLEPFHTFSFASNSYPLTQKRFLEVIENPAVFSGAAKPPGQQKSLIDQLYPPYQQRQGFGRLVDGTGGITGAAGINKVAGLGLGGQIANKVAPGMMAMVKRGPKALLEPKAVQQVRNVGMKLAEYTPITKVTQLTPRQLHRYADLKATEKRDNVATAASQNLSLKDKAMNLKGPLGFSAAAGGGVAAAKILHKNRKNLAGALSKGSLKSVAGGAALGAGLAGANMAFNAIRRKGRMKDRQSAEYGNFFEAPPKTLQEAVPQPQPIQKQAMYYPNPTSPISTRERLEAMHKEAGLSTLVQGVKAIGSGVKNMGGIRNVAKAVYKNPVGKAAIIGGGAGATYGAVTAKPGQSRLGRAIGFGLGGATAGMALKGTHMLGKASKAVPPPKMITVNPM